MNRTGLAIALTIAVIVGTLFGFYPQLDLDLARLFYLPDVNRFVSHYQRGWMIPLRESAMWLVAACTVPPIVALVVKLVRPQRPLLVSGRAILFLLSTLAIGPGLIVNTGLKEHWNRSRPIDVPQLGGSEHFTAWWDPRGGCDRNCSFVTGDGAGAFWALAPASLAPAPWRPAAYAAALALGLGVGALRMAFGAHFFSDVMFAGLIVFVLIWVAHGLIYRWPRTRLDDARIDAALTAAITRAYRRIGRLFGREPQ